MKFQLTFTEDEVLRALETGVLKDLVLTTNPPADAWQDPSTQTPPVAQANTPAAPVAPLQEVTPAPITPAPVATPNPAAPVTPVPAAVPAPAPVPTAIVSYDLPKLQLGAAQIMDAGCQPELLRLLESFGVQALTLLPPEQYGAFAAKLRELGAKL